MYITIWIENKFLENFHKFTLEEEELIEGFTYTLTQPPATNIIRETVEVRIPYDIYIRLRDV